MVLQPSCKMLTQFMRGLYEGIDVGAHVKELRRTANARLLFGVDATRLEAGPACGGAYDRVVFHSPCLPVAAGRDGQSAASGRADADALRANRSLVRAFARSASGALRSGGELHVTHKTKPPFDWWGFPGLVSDAAPDLAFQGALVFDRHAFSPYANRKACDRASFTANDALTYVYARGGRDASDATLPARGAAAAPDAAFFAGAPAKTADPVAAHAANAVACRVDAELLARVRDAAAAAEARKRRPNKAAAPPRKKHRR